MTDYGDVGYLPTVNVEDSCYLTVDECQITVLIIGKRYGSHGTNGLSVTQNEFQTSKDRRIPVITLIENEVLTFKRLFDANPQSNFATFPGMDEPAATFSFVDEISKTSVNNGFVSYTNVSDARSKLKYQLAHLFGDLLRKSFDPVRGEVRDVLSEIKTLRHELVKGTEKQTAQLFLRSVRFFLEDRNRGYRELAEQLCTTLEEAIPILLRSKTFEEFVNSAGGSLVLENTPHIMEMIISKDFYYCVHQPMDGRSAEDEQGIATCGITSKNQIFMNAPAKELFASRHDSFKKLIPQD